MDRAHRARDKPDARRAPRDERDTPRFKRPFRGSDAPPAAPVEDSFDLLGSEDVAPPAPPSRQLVESAGSVTGDLFQAKWAAISDQDERTLRVGPVTQGADLVDAMLASLHVHTMASGQVGEELKFFVYARDALGALYLAQAVISTASMETQLTVKTEGAGDASFFAGVVEEGRGRVADGVAKVVYIYSLQGGGFLCLLRRVHCFQRRADGAHVVAVVEWARFRATLARPAQPARVSGARHRARAARSVSVSSSVVTASRRSPSVASGVAAVEPRRCSDSTSS